MKKRVLLVSEGSYLPTGFGKYGYYLLSRLRKDPNYHVAEFAFNCVVNDKGDYKIPWRLYANRVLEKDPRYKEFVSFKYNKYGAWRFEEVLFDFKPHVVISICDPWMYHYIERSPLRPYFKFVLMPTVDSLPYKSAWYHQIKQADLVLTYSKWAFDELKSLNEDIKLYQPAYAGVDFDIYKPTNKDETKKELGINSESIVIGTVMANQPRKLFGDLFQSFSYILEQNKDKNIYLLCRTKLALPNKRQNTLHWNIPKIVKDYGIENNVLFPYKCGGCKHLFLDLFKGEKTYCYKCNQMFANTFMPLEEEDMAKLYNSMDIYLQLVSAGGFEIPIIEAAACNVQTFAVNFACMKDFVNTIGTIPIEPAKIVRDTSTDAERCITDNHVVANTISDYIELKEKPSINIEKVKELYNWHNVCEIWKTALDSINVEDNWEKTLEPIGKIKFNKVPSIFDLYYIFVNMLNNTDDASFLETIQYMNVSEIIKLLEKLITNYNACISILSSKNKQEDDYIKYANIKEKLHA